MTKFKSALVLLLVALLAGSALAQQKKDRPTRRPDPSLPASSAAAPAPSGEFFSILDGTPMLLNLFHDTEVGTNNPIDIYDFVIELQIMNSDGDLEPVGLQIHNFYTAKPLDPHNDVNPRNSRDCRIWNKLITEAIQHRNPKLQTWSYVEFTVAEGARILQTNMATSGGATTWSAGDRATASPRSSSRVAVALHDFKIQISNC